MPHPDGLPDLFIDRSLGRLVVPRLLRAEGLRLTTLAERYGIPADESISDVTWLADVGARQEVAFMKDDRIRVEIQGWVFPRSGVAFVWTLEREAAEHQRAAH